jgi:mercuric ion transport protein
VVSLFTCPCHYFLILPLLAGTAAGAFFSDHLIATISVMSLLFLYTLYMGWKKTKQREA